MPHRGRSNDDVHAFDRKPRAFRAPPDWRRLSALRCLDQRIAQLRTNSEQGYGMAEQNAYQVADWNGQSGERWVANQARLDAMLAGFGQAAIETPAPAMGERVLDGGRGAGAPGLAPAAPLRPGGPRDGLGL